MSYNVDISLSDGQESVDGSNKNNLNPYCVIYLGEKIDVNSNVFTIDKIGKKSIVLKYEGDIANIRVTGLKYGDRIKVKNSLLIVMSMGSKYLTLKASYGTVIINGELVVDDRVQRLKQLREKQII